MTTGDAYECLVEAGDVDVVGLWFVNPTAYPVTAHRRDET
jgi:hypothetical protein